MPVRQREEVQEVPRHLTVGLVAACGLTLLAAQENSDSGVFTAAQAAAGRTAVESTCGQCHTNSLLGRKGVAGELPPVESLPKSWQDFLKPYGGAVPPLAGPEFLAKWGGRSIQELAQRLREGVGGFPPPGMDDATYVNITAYVLQVNGAKAGGKALGPATAGTVTKAVGGR